LDISRTKWKKSLCREWYSTYQ